MSSQNAFQKTASSNFTIDQLLNFYDPFIGGTDHQGRRFDDIISWPADRLESTHDFIQLLFPLPEPSQSAPTSPVLTVEATRYFRGHLGLKDNMKLALVCMMSFYGFQVDWSPCGTVVTIVPKNVQNPYVRWYVDSSHHHRRITRIIRSLRVLGLLNESTTVWTAFRDAIEERGGDLDNSTVKIWKRAYTDDLQYPPMAQNPGPAWLSVLQAEDLEAAEAGVAKDGNAGAAPNAPGAPGPPGDPRPHGTRRQREAPGPPGNSNLDMGDASTDQVRPGKRRRTDVNIY
ncbi:opioid growth factor receptor conserved region-domain-containing protein [Hypoxylon crocopeplum]|nr:opioid growth factor receptor conserved region-domain-containing protein [Hypoxylon crocopeplum]